MTTKERKVAKLMKDLYFYTRYLLTVFRLRTGLFHVLVFILVIALVLLLIFLFPFDI
jgi:hypothetical protein